jgi:serine/threonine protein kinase
MIGLIVRLPLSVCGRASPDGQPSILVQGWHAMEITRKLRPAPDAHAPTCVVPPPVSAPLTPTSYRYAASADLLPELEHHPRYRIVRLIGEGGMGAVFLAEHMVMHRMVALKVIKGGLREHPEFLERFREEVKAAARLTHPNIVAALDAEAVGDSLFLVMEYIDGVSLQSVLKESGPLPVARACDIAIQVADALDHAHREKLTHGDIKPENIMLSGDKIKILDFGLASLERDLERDLESQTSSHAKVVYGTPDYMAPEQTMLGKAVDGRADLYSLGCTLYQMIAGKVPFADVPLESKMTAQREQSAAPLADVPRGLQRVLDRLLAKSPAARFSTAAEVVEALVPFGSDGSQKTTSPRRQAIRIALGALACTAIGIAIAVVSVPPARIESAPERPTPETPKSLPQQQLIPLPQKEPDRDQPPPQPVYSIEQLPPPKAAPKLQPPVLKKIEPE